MNFKKIKSILTFEYWHIGIIDKSLEQIVEADYVNSNIKWFKYHYPDRFFADPFILKIKNNKLYCLAEEYTFYDRKGRIVQLIFDLDSMKCISRRVLIDDKTHLSFPFIYNGNIYPENFRSGSYYEYKIGSDSITKKLVASIPAIDPIIYEEGGVKYLFASYREEALNKLRLFYYENDIWIEHPMSPIVDNIHCARMAGNLFVVNGLLYRPAQDCEIRYGESVRIMQIKALSKTNYEEREVCHIDSHSCTQFDLGLHTFNTHNGIVVIDGYEKRVRPILKVIIAIKKRLMLSKKIERIENGKLNILEQ